MNYGDLARATVVLLGPVLILLLLIMFWRSLKPYLIDGTIPGCAMFVFYLGYCLAGLFAGYLGFAHYFGPKVAVAALGICYFFQFGVPITIAAFFGARDVWQWPWYGALAFAFPVFALAVPSAILSLFKKRTK